MSVPSSSAPKPTGPAKPGVSPTRNLIGLIVLAVVVVVGGMQVMAKVGYNSSVNKFNERAKEEEKDLMTEAEAEGLMGGKKPNDAGTEVHIGPGTYLKKDYTWSGPIQSYTLSAYYTTSKMGTKLHHFETDEKKYVPDEAPKLPESAPVPTKGGGGGGGRGGRTKKDGADKKESGKKDEEKKGMQPPSGPSDAYRKAMEKAPASKPDDKKAEDKAPAPGADQKAPAAKADDKAPAAKADDKAPAAKADDKTPAAKADDKKADDKAK